MNHLALVITGVAAISCATDALSAETEGTVERRGLAQPGRLPSPPASTMPTLPITPPAPAPIPIPYPSVASRLSPELAAISSMMAEGKSTNAIMDAWTTYVRKQVQAKQPLDVPATVQQIRLQAEAQVKARMDAQKKSMADRLNSVGDDAQLANVDLQNMLQKQQQTLQMMSNISKMMHDTATATIRKIGG